jgi:O-antigen/teichoic acid export membrane protein
MSGLKNLFVKIGINAIAILSGEMLSKVSTYFVYFIVGHYAGAEVFGQLALGLALLYTFHVFAVAGLPTLITRKVSMTPESSLQILYNGYLATLLPSLFSIFAMSIFTLAMNYQSLTSQTILLLSLALLPYSLTMIAEATIRGREQMPWIVAGNLPGSILLVSGSYLAMSSGASVVVLAGIVVLSRTLTFFMMQLCCWWAFKSSQVQGLGFREAWKLLSDSLVFFWSDGVAAIAVSLNSVLLSKYATEREVGYLSASFQLLQPMAMIYRSVGHSSFPALVRAAAAGSSQLASLCAMMISALLRIALPATFVVFWTGKDLLSLAYGNADFEEAGRILQILSVTLLLDPLNPVLGHGLWAKGKERLVLWIVIVNFLVTAALGFWLIGQYGIDGAAWSIVIASVVNVLQHVFYFQLAVHPLQIGRELLKLAPSAILASLCLFLPIHPYVAMGLALVVYGAINAYAIVPVVTKRNSAALHDVASGKVGR